MMSTKSKAPLAAIIWGEGAHGKLGLGDTQRQDYPVVLDIDNFDGEGLKDIRCGHNTTAAITESGRLYMWGSQKYFLCGNGVSSGYYDTPTVVEFFKDKPVRDVQLGPTTTFVITESGSLYSWGWGGGLTSAGCLGHGDWESREEPTVVEFFEDKKLMDVAVGGYHATSVVEGGRVYSWGRGAYGRLGVGASSDHHTPTEVPLFEYQPAKYVAAGDAYCSALTENGQLYSWGANDNLQLGIGPSPTLDVQSMEADPQAVRGVNYSMCAATAIACGGKHGIALMTDGKAYEWGAHRSAIANLVEYLDDEWGVAAPGEKLTDFKVTDISAGKNFSAVVTETGEMFTWGGTTKCLGIGENTWVKAPIMFANRDDFEFPLIRKVSCGQDHMAALFEDDY